ncbi:dihydroxy-acid dehydratase [Methylibium sp.]|uniref:dihydroxy-acid dehydratase n=1 Tax=Methylibium sp. TaxID=2067992 RepID=UPI0017D8ADF9|nr:dihydroxy-acid dehydratase [Methylibium sp.]MBA3590210.1 dihydroxy-acid dehydratase [Methylibium sp.]
MVRPLRSNFERGSTRWAVRHAQWSAMGIAEADFDKPKIAIVNTSSQLSVCFQHLDGIARRVSDAIRATGGLPFEVRTAAPSDFVTSAGRQGRYLMPTRDLIVNDIEVQIEGAELDGMLLLSSCDKTTPAHLMAAARLDVPSLILACGYQLGRQCGEHHVDIEEVYKAVGTVKAGQMSIEGLEGMCRVAIDGPGVCAGLATANSMHCLAEALGMTLPGNGPIRADGPRLHELAAQAGARIVEMVSEDLRPRAILTPGAFRNAVRFAVATGCSVNVMRHLIATAIEAECNVDVIEEFERAADQVPLLTRIRPNGPHRIEEFEAAGGCRAVMARLGTLIDGEVRTVSGHSVAEVLARAPDIDANIIRPLDDPFAHEPGLMIIRGSLAPDGALVKLAAVPQGIRRFRGEARVFEDEAVAIQGLESHTVEAGQVIVLRMLGPKGGPGTVFAASFMAALVGAGLGSDVAVVTDGELSGLNSGITIGQVMPEAAEGGPLAAVRDGDVIEIDLTARRIELEVDAGEIARRLEGFTPPQPKGPFGWLHLYGQLVQPLSRGAVLGARSVSTTPALTPRIVRRS